MWSLCLFFNVSMQWTYDLSRVSPSLHSSRGELQHTHTVTLKSILRRLRMFSNSGGWFYRNDSRSHGSPNTRQVCGSKTEELPCKKFESAAQWRSLVEGHAGDTALARQPTVSRFILSILINYRYNTVDHAPSNSHSLDLKDTKWQGTDQTFVCCIGD